MTAGVNEGEGNSVNIPDARGHIGALGELYTGRTSEEVSSVIDYNQLDGFSSVNIHEAWLQGYGAWLDVRSTDIIDFNVCGFQRK